MRREPTAAGAEPMAPAEALAALDDVIDREQVFLLLLRATRARARYAALLSVHTAELRGRRALADAGFERAAIDQLAIPRDAVPALETAIRRAAPHVGPIATGTRAADVLLARMGGLPPSAMVLPIAVHGRTIALVLAHNGGDPITADDIGDLIPVVTSVGAVLGRMLGARAATAAPRPDRRATTEGAAVEITYDPLTTQRRLVDKLRADGRHEELAEAIRGLVRMGVEGGEPDEEEQLALLYELGQVEAERLGRPELAALAWRSAQTIDATDARVHAALEALYTREGQWEACIDLLDKRAALTEATAERTELLLAIAALARDRLGDDERAVQAYERVLAWDATNEVALSRLEELYAAMERWQPLAGLLLDRASRTVEPDTRLTALEAVARMYEDKVGDPGAAALVWLTILRRAPGRADVLDQIERLAGADAAAWDEVVPDCEALAGELERTDRAAAARLWRRLAAWKRDHAGNRDEAMAALERVGQLIPDDRASLRELAELRRVDGPWVDLADVLARLVELEPVPGLRAELAAELGTVYRERLGQIADATAAYERALADDPTCVPALIALRELYRDAEAWAPLARVVEALLDALGADAGRDEIVARNVELGALYAEKLARPDDAVRAFQNALALDPQHAPAFHGLEGVYQTTGQTEKLLVTIEAEVDAEVAADGAAARRYADLASAWDDLLGDHARAAATWRKLLAASPDHPAAHAGLARALRRAGAWDELAAAHRAHLARPIDDPTRVAVLLELAGVLADGLGDLDGALLAYRRVLAVAPDHPVAHDAIVTLHERGERWGDARAALEARLATTPEPKRRAELLYRIGAVHLGARDPAVAMVSLEQALALDPELAPIHEAMARVYIERGEPALAGERLLRAGDLYPGRADRVRCFADAAWLYRGRLGDDDRARDCLQRVLALDPGHHDAKRELAELYAGAGQWERLWPHLEQQVAALRADPAAPSAHRLDVYRQAARCALELGRHAAALELYDLARQLAPDDAGLELDRADALYRQKAWPRAADAYQAIVLHHVSALPPAQLGEVYRRLALVHDAQGKHDQAVAFHQKVLDVDPTNQASLDDLVGHHLARGRFDEAIGCLRALAGAVPPGQRAAVHERMGDLYRARLANAGRAASSYLAALDDDPGNRRVLQKLLDLQSETGQWKAALATIDKFLAIEAVPARRGAYLAASASIRRVNLKDEAGALDVYDQALDEYFAGELDADGKQRAFAAFEAIDELCTAHRDWKRQEQAYRRMIKRVPAGDPILVVLWHALGEIYRSRLKLYQSAIEAFEVAHSLDPDKSPVRGKILAELYSLIGLRMPETVTDRTAKLVEADPQNPDAYRALAKTSLEAGRVDEAWCACRALVYLKVASAAEDALYRHHQAQEVHKATGILDDPTWDGVRHPGEDPVLDAIFALCWEGPVALRSGPPRSFDLRAKDRMQVEGESRVIAKIFRHAARVLNAPLPDVYVQPRRAGRLLLANCLEKDVLAPAVIVGRDLMKGYRDTELAYIVGCTIALLRPAYYLRLALPGLDEIEAALAAAATVVGKKVTGARPANPALVTTFAAAIQDHIAPTAGGALAALIGRLDAPDLMRWQTAVDATARRASLLVCGELAAAARMVASEAVTPGGARPADKVRDLVAFSVSPGYFAARRHLGVEVR